MDDNFTNIRKKKNVMNADLSCHGNIEHHEFIRNYFPKMQFNFLITVIKERIAGV